MDHDWDALARGLDQRLDACMAFPFQIRAEPHLRLRDPLTGGRVLLNRARAARTRPTSRGGAEGCPYCQGRTPPTLFYLRDAEGAGAGRRAACRDGALVVEDERESLIVAADHAGEGATDTWALLDRLARARRADAAGRPVPVTHPAEPWLARVFLNATPIVSDPASAANGFVVSVPAAYHGLDLAPLALAGAGPVRVDEAESGRPGAETALPIPVIEALLTCWALLEAWADRRGLLSVPFVNGGKDRASGQSIDCFHGQTVTLGAQDRPPLLETMAAARGSGCPLCALVGDESLRAYHQDGVVVAAHPAPQVECSLVIAPAAHVTGLRALPDLGALARAVSAAAHCLASVLGGLPPYNLCLRAGAAAGHVHLEMVPRARVGVAGGFELATGFSVLSREPAAMACHCREYVDGRAAGCTGDGA